MDIESFSDINEVLYAAFDDDITMDSKIEVEVNIFIILPNKKTLRTLIQYSGISYFAGTMAGWQTSNIYLLLFAAVLPDKCVIQFLMPNGNFFLVFL